MNKILSVLSIGYGRHMFLDGDVERKRMLICAKETESFSMVIFSLKTHGLETQAVSGELTLYPTNSSSKLMMIFDAFRIASEIIKSRENKIVVTTQDSFESGLVGYFLKKKFPVHLTVQEHGDVFSGSYWKNESAGNRFRFYLGKYILRRVDTIRVVSDRIEKTISDMHLPAKITKLPVAIDFDYLSKNILDKKAESEKQMFQFLTVARFVPQKNLPLMIKAFAEAYKKNKNINLLLVGKGVEESLVRKIIKESFLNSEDCPVKIIDWSDEVPLLMQEADAYLLSSNYEGWARVLVESIMYDLPVVTTDVGCAGEVVLDKVHGYVVPVNDQKSLAQAIVKMATDKYMYREFKDKIAATKRSGIAGSDVSKYGKQWVETVR